MSRDTVTAAVLLIGDELLSGRTKDINLGYIAEFMTGMAIEVREARFVPDIEDEIVAALNALRSRYDYVFTTGGIGPTHDDITADAVAHAFGLEIGHNPEAIALMKARYEDGELNEARMRMARTPVGASLIPNKLSAAPGFRVENVFVMAGVPKIMQAMLDEVGPTLERGKPLLSHSVRVDAGEGTLAAPLKAIQDAHPGVSIGSYPFSENGRFGANVVIRSKDEAELEAAHGKVQAMAEELAGSPNPVIKVWS